MNRSARILLTAAAVLILAALLCRSISDRPWPDGSVMSGKYEVCEIDSDGYMLVRDLEPDVNGNKQRYSTHANGKEFFVGDIVRVRYTGGIAESDPCQFIGFVDIELVERPK